MAVLCAGFSAAHPSPTPNPWSINYNFLTLTLTLTLIRSLGAAPEYEDKFGQTVAPIRVRVMQ